MRFYGGNAVPLLENEVAHVASEVIPSDLQDKCLEMELTEAISCLEDQLANASAFALSNKPLSCLNTMAPGSASGMLTAFDPEPLERNIQLSGQELSDAIRQLQADLQLAANLENKRAAESELALQKRLNELSAHADERMAMVNEQLDRVSRQILTAIGAFVGTLAVVFATYTISKK